MGRREQKPESTQTSIAEYSLSQWHLLSLYQPLKADNDTRTRYSEPCTYAYATGGRERERENESERATDGDYKASCAGSCEVRSGRCVGDAGVAVGDPCIRAPHMPQKLNLEFI